MSTSLLALLFALACLAVAFTLTRTVPALRGWPPAFGLLVSALTVVPPHATLAVGIGVDDLLLPLGLVLLLPHVRWDVVRPQRMPYGRWLLTGVALLLAGMVISSFVNSSTPVELVSFLVRGPGRVLLYAVAVLVIAGQVPQDRVRWLVTRVLAGIGIGQAVLGLGAYGVGVLLGGPVFGLEEARGNTSLLGEVPGRITGTFELSSNFLGAVLTLSIPVTLGLLLDARGRVRVGWTLAVLVQFTALVLTFTRSSLGLTLLACLVLLALRARIRYLLAGLVVVVGLLVGTPAGERLVSDQTDRLALWTSAWTVFVDHPVAGVGPGEQATVTAANPEVYRATPFGVAGNNAHNTVLLAAAENGVAGLLGALVLNVAFVLIAVALIRRARVSGTGLVQPLGVAVAMLAFLAQGMVNNLFTVTLTATTLVVLVAGAAMPWLAAGSVERSRADPRDAADGPGDEPGDDADQPGDRSGDRSTERADVEPEERLPRSNQV